MKEKRKKKSYQKPSVLYEKKIEVLAAVCNSARGGFSGCKAAGCTRPLT